MERLQPDGCDAVLDLYATDGPFPPGGGGFTALGGQRVKLAHGAVKIAVIKLALGAGENGVRSGSRELIGAAHGEEHANGVAELGQPSRTLGRGA